MACNRTPNQLAKKSLEFMGNSNQSQLLPDRTLTTKAKLSFVTRVRKSQVEKTTESEFSNPYTATKQTQHQKIKIHEAEPQAKEILLRRMSYVPDLKKRKPGPYNQLGSFKVNETPQTFLEEYLYRKVARNSRVDPVSSNPHLSVGETEIKTLLNKDNRDFNILVRTMALDNDNTY